MLKSFCQARNAALSRLCHHCKKTHAFSLIELAIVLAILGLLVGGVISVQSLIKSAELRRLTSDYSKFVSAVMSFRDAYHYLPGDIPDATDYWGQVATGTACNTATTTGLATCNGNGNGIVGNNDGTGNEVFRFWQHLANAEMIEESYTGAGSVDSITGENVPDARVNKAGWCVRWDDASAGGTLWSKHEGGHSFLVGQPNTSDPCQGIFMWPADLWQIDQKLDDGNPVNGKVRAGILSTCTDNTLSNYSDAVYDLNRKSDSCVLQFFKPF